MEPASLEPAAPVQEVVVEKVLGGYRLPDQAIDLEAWLRDGLEVYNLFTAMKPLFFQMLEAHGGTFRGSSVKAADERLAHRLTIRYEKAGSFDDGTYDEIMIAELAPAPVAAATPPKAATPPVPS